MRSSTFITIGIAIVLGSIAAFLAKVWLEGQVSAPVLVQSPDVTTRTVVIASQPLRFGAPLTRQVLAEVKWPANAIPEGSFSSMTELLKGQQRSVLTAIEKHEPVLKWKVTGPGQRATLSALISDNNMKAITIRVDDVKGVAGFVLPNDRVDIFLTRTEQSTSGGEKTSQQFTDLLLQNVKVLAVGQIADDKRDKPAPVKVVTVEVDPVAAQKLVLAASAGRLSLALRRAGSPESVGSRRITLGDLTGGSAPPAKDKEISVVEEKPDLNALIGVIRGAKKPENISVPRM